VLGTGLAEGAVARSASPLARLVSWLCQSKKATPPVTSSNNTGTSDALRLCSFDFLMVGSEPKDVGAVPALVPERMNFGSPESGACGATILWKQVGHSNGFPLALESAVICCPQTGQANLNSLISHINNSTPKTGGQLKNLAPPVRSSTERSIYAASINTAASARCSQPGDLSTVSNSFPGQVREAVETARWFQFALPPG
jgi:hypothetical protein